MILADTNILSTFAKIGELPLLISLFKEDRIGVVPAVHEELQNGLSKGYSALKDAIELIHQAGIDLVALEPQEILEKGDLPRSFDEGERETIAVALSRGWTVLTNETLVKNWCKKAGIQYCDLPGILRAFWRENLLSKEQVSNFIEQ